MNSLQLANQDDKRTQIINGFTELATGLELSWMLDGDTLTITLPKPDEVDLPIVGTIDVPEGEQ